MLSSVVLSLIQGFLLAAILSLFIESHLTYRSAMQTLPPKILAWFALGLFMALISMGAECAVARWGYSVAAVCNVIVIILFMLAICFSLFEGTILRKLFLAFVGVVLSTAAEGVAVFLISPYWSAELSYQKSGHIYVLTYGIYLAVLLILSLLVRRYRKDTRLVGGNRLFALQCIVPACSVLFMFIYTVSGMNDFGIELHLSFVAFIVIVNTFIYATFSQQQRLYQERYEAMLVAQDYRHREEYYQELEEHQKEVRMIRHDLKNALLATSDGRSIVEVKELLDTLEQSPVRFTENIGLNQLIASKMRRAQENSIECDFNIQMPEYMTFRQMDIGALIGNIMDNAIEACQHCPADRVFKLELLYQGHTLIIRSENSTDGVVDTTMTRKPDKAMHGFGMRSIESIVRKYNGTCTWEVQDGRFVLEALLWEPKCQK